MELFWVEPHRLTRIAGPMRSWFINAWVIHMSGETIRRCCYSFTARQKGYGIRVARARAEIDARLGFAPIVGYLAPQIRFL